MRRKRKSDGALGNTFGAGSSGGRVGWGMSEVRASGPMSLGYSFSLLHPSPLSMRPPEAHPRPGRAFHRRRSSLLLDAVEGVIWETYVVPGASCGPEIRPCTVRRCEVPDLPRRGVGTRGPIRAGVGRRSPVCVGSRPWADVVSVGREVAVRVVHSTRIVEGPRC